MSDSLLELAEGCVKYDFGTVEMIGCKWQLWDEILAVLRAAPRCDAEIRDALEELCDIVEGVRSGESRIDSFTTQPARAALALPAADREAPQQARLDTINACAQAAMDAYSQTTTDQYALEGPAGMASRMVGAIRTLAFSSTDGEAGK